AHFGSDTSRIFRALRNSTILVGKDNKGEVTFHRSHQTRSAHGDLNASLVGSRIFEKHWHKCAKQLEISSVDFLGKLFRVSRHEPPVSQFGSRIARLSDFAQHLDIVRSFTFQVEFERTPGARSICYLNHVLTSFRFSSIPTSRNGLIGRWPQGSLDSWPQRRNRGNTPHPGQHLG